MRRSAVLSQGYGSMAAEEGVEAPEIESLYVRALLELSGSSRRPMSRRLLGPVARQRYLYASADPADLLDPRGLATAVEGGIFTGISRPLVVQIVKTVGTGIATGSGLAVLATAVKTAEECMTDLVECLERKGYRQPEPDCGACYRYCNHYKAWPKDKCPQ